MPEILSQQKPDILCFSSTDWAGIWGSRQQLMLRFARRGYRVLYVEQLAGWEHLLRYPELHQRKRQRWQEVLRRVEENLWIVSAPALLPGRYYARIVNQFNTRRVFHWAQSPIKKLKIKTPILWLYKPEHSDLVGRFDERLCVYHCIDQWTAGTKGRKRQVIAQLDKTLVKKAGLVFANSQPTYENKSRINSNTHRLPSGVDIDLFAQAMHPALAEHEAIAALPRPRIGYIGTINERLDYTYLQALAKARPEWSLVFAGDPYPWKMDAPDLQRLEALTNVHFLGNLPYRQLPALLKGIDVCLVPYINDERGYYRSPLKLYEYLAAGRPVVSTDHPEVNEFANLVRIAKNPPEFINQVAAALDEDSPEERQTRNRIAGQHSWEKRVDQMELLIQRALQGTP